MDDTNPYQSSNIKPRPLDRSRSFAMRVGLVLCSTSVACLLAVAFGYWASIAMDSPYPALLAIAVLPPAGAWLGGVRSRGQLLKIAAYGVTVWFLCFLLQPAVVRARTDPKPRIDGRWIVTAFIPSSLLALIGAGCACRREERED